MTRWQYLILDDDELGDLDTLGAEGWELVTVVRRSWNDKGYKMEQSVYYFKRQIAEGL